MSHRSFIVPILYELFSRVLDERLKRFLDKEQSVDQAGFRGGFGCDDHMWLAAVDFRKAFDWVEHWAIWDALGEFRVPEKYVEALAALYDGQTGRVCEDKGSRAFKIGRGTKQGDPISPKLFNAVLEVVVRKLKAKWNAKRWGLKMKTVWRRTFGRT